MLGLFVLMGYPTGSVQLNSAGEKPPACDQQCQFDQAQEFIDSQVSKMPCKPAKEGTWPKHVLVHDFGGVTVYRLPFDKAWARNTDKSKSNDVVVDAKCTN